MPLSLSSYAPVTPYSFRLNTSFLVGEPPMQEDFSLAENSIFGKSFSRPVTCAQRPPKPNCFTNHSTNQESQPHCVQNLNFPKTFTENSTCCGFVPGPAQFLQFLTEFHCSQLLLSYVDEERMRECPVSLQVPCPLQPSSLLSGSF